MKTLAIIVLSISMLITVSPAFSQGPPPPPSGGHSQTGNQTGGNAPLGRGMFIMLTLGAVYGGIKIRNKFANNPDNKLT